MLKVIYYATGVMTWVGGEYQCARTLPELQRIIKRKYPHITFVWKTKNTGATTKQTTRS